MGEGGRRGGQQRRGGGGGAAGGGGCGGESKAGDQEDSREAQFADLLGRCVRAARLSSDELSTLVLTEPLVENSFAAFRMMTRVLQERAADPARKVRLAGAAVSAEGG